MARLSLAKLERHLYSAADRCRSELIELMALKEAVSADLLAGRIQVPAEVEGRKFT